MTKRQIFFFAIEYFHTNSQKILHTEIWHSICFYLINFDSQWASLTKLWIKSANSTFNSSFMLILHTEIWHSITGFDDFWFTKSLLMQILHAEIWHFITSFDSDEMFEYFHANFANRGGALSWTSYQGGLVVSSLLVTGVEWGVISVFGSLCMSILMNMILTATSMILEDLDFEYIC